MSASDKYFLDRIHPQGVEINIFYKGTTSNAISHALRVARKKSFVWVRNSVK
jgi:hypothetical protein